ncbi:hypothetical protein GGR51DRAFT_556775 [Nemania sp. FL0031]|nr:hypothetical protein GGR51DRAFT_556775 [Nemania sp. FL0031]
MYLAERKNEDELRRMYRRGEVKGDVSYSYSKDESNQTSSASILVWRVEKMEDGTVKVGEPEEMIFRDSEGNAIQSESLSLSFKDFICTSIMDSDEGKLEAPSLEISSGTLCRTIQTLLEEYREQRARVKMVDIKKWA